jgi:cytochrome c
MNYKALSIALALIAGALFAQSTRSVREGIYTPEQALRGRELYAQKCYFCHGRELRGEGETRPLSTDRFLTDWEGTTVLQLFDRIRNTMPFKTPGTLSRQESADLTAFILYFNGYPAGPSELSTKSEVLQGIQIELPKR